jgi:hypothetical protein
VTLPPIAPRPSSPQNFCTARHYQPGNTTGLSQWTFNVEAGFFEALLQSEHRTLDPEEAGGHPATALLLCKEQRCTASSGAALQAVVLLCKLRLGTDDVCSISFVALSEQPFIRQLASGVRLWSCGCLRPSPADFFYVPVFTSCYIEPVR